MWHFTFGFEYISFLNNNNNFLTVLSQFYVANDDNAKKLC